MLKKIIIALVLIAVIAGAIVYLCRHMIIKYYAEKIIRENLPGYIKIDGVNFDFANNKFSLTNFRVLNPPGFSSQFMVKINEISCKYGILGKGIPKALEISDISLNGADIRVERLKDSAVNVVAMEKFVSSLRSRDLSAEARSAKAEAAEAISRKKIASLPLVARNDGLTDLIKLPSSFDIKHSKFVFIDKMSYENPYIVTVESINGRVTMDFSDNYSKITALSFALVGRLNGYREELIQWAGSLNPATPKITMSNRFEVSNLNLLTFEPYYDRFSPFNFRRGRFSGTLVFDFNNGAIGSTNEIRLSNVAFSVKPGYENAQMWETTVPDIVSYFTTTSGDIVFDFKIKGDMANPAFYLGPISKRAIASMAIDKIASYAIKQVTKQGDATNKGIDKAQEAIDMVRELIKKK